MLEYIFTGFIVTIIILSFCIINRPYIISKIFRRFLIKDKRGELRNLYIDHFREHKQSDIGRSIIVQLVPLLGVMFLMFFLGNQYFFFATVISGSMEPTFKKGDMVLMQSLDRNVEVGDIVVFRQFGIKEPITHRAVQITDKGYVMTKGDANNFIDIMGGIPPDRIAAKAIVIGDKPIMIKELGFLIKAESLGEFGVISKIPVVLAFSRSLEQFRTISPLILFFCVIFYFFILLETRVDFNRRFKGKNGRKKIKD